MRGVRWMALAALIAALPNADAARASSGGITGHSGRNNPTCNTCHDGGMRPEVAFVGPETVDAGATVTLRFTVRAASPVGKAGGFNVAAEAGTLIVIPGEDVRRSAGELTHTDPKDNDDDRTAGWDFQWTAPAAVGTYRLWGAGNAVNLNGQSTGDRANTAVLRIEVVAAAATPTATPTATPLPPTPTASPSPPAEPTTTATLPPSPTSPPTETAPPTATAVATVTAESTATAGGDDTPTPPASVTPSATGTAPPLACAGDCDGDAAVAINELVTAVGIALGAQPLTLCPSVDQNADGGVAINELIAAVARALGGC